MFETLEQWLNLNSGFLINRAQLFHRVSSFQLNYELMGQPPRGINWLTQGRSLKAVIAKSNFPVKNEYPDTFLDNNDRKVFKYYFMEQNGKTDINYKPNTILNLQRLNKSIYPVILLTKFEPNSWRFEGYFDVINIGNDGNRKYCLLNKRL